MGTTEREEERERMSQEKERKGEGGVSGIEMEGGR